MSFIFFYIFILNFILALSQLNKNFNIILSIINKFSKQIILILNKIIYININWAILLLEQLQLVN